MPLVTMGAILGGHVRVGLEDSLSLGRGELATSCTEQVNKIRRILTELSLDIAIPAEARTILGLEDALGLCDCGLQVPLFVMLSTGSSPAPQQ